MSLCHNRLPCQAMRDEGYLSELGLYRGSHFKTPCLVTLNQNKALGQIPLCQNKAPRQIPLCQNKTPR